MSQNDKHGAITPGGTALSDDDLDRVAGGTQTGTVDWYNSDTGQGMITGADGEKYFLSFAHTTEGSRDHLAAGMPVKFDVGSTGGKGLTAINVTG